MLCEVLIFLSNYAKCVYTCRIENDEHIPLSIENVGSNRSDTIEPDYWRSIHIVKDEFIDSAGRIL